MTEKKLKEIYSSYLTDAAQVSEKGDACEESHYPALKKLLEDFARAQGKTTVHVTVLPKNTEAGSPDFRVWDDPYRVIGYIEARAPGAKLDEVEVSEQLQRYRHTFPNLILTDFYEFRLYRNGLEMKRILLSRSSNAKTAKVAPSSKQVEKLTQLFETFFSFALPPLLTAEGLACELAQRTRFLRDEVVRPALAEQVKQKNGDLYGFHQAFQKYLIADLTEEQFADFYVQTSPMVCSPLAPAPRTPSTAGWPIRSSRPPSVSCAMSSDSFRSAGPRGRWRSSWTTSLPC